MRRAVHLLSQVAQFRPRPATFSLRVYDTSYVFNLLWQLKTVKWKSHCGSSVGQKLPYYWYPDILNS